MLSDEITYLKDSDDVWTTTIIGGVFVLLSVLILPVFFVWGYVVRVLERTSRGDDEAPRFDGWDALTVDGAKAVAILVAYALLPIAVGGLLFGSLSVATGGEPGPIGTVAIGLSSVLTLAITLAVAYVAPAALANFAADGRLGAAFAFDALRPSLTTGTYAIGWLQAVAIVVVGSLLTGILTEIPILGALLGTIVSFYALAAPTTSSDRPGRTSTPSRSRSAPKRRRPIAPPSEPLSFSGIRTPLPVKRRSFAPNDGRPPMDSH